MNLPTTRNLEAQKFRVSCGDHGIPTASVHMIGPDGKDYRDAALGTGPVDAAYEAINRIVGGAEKRIDRNFNINALTEGLDAVAEATIRIQPYNGESQYAFNPDRSTGSTHSAVMVPAQTSLSPVHALVECPQQDAGSPRGRIQHG